MGETKTLFLHLSRMEKLETRSCAMTALQWFGSSWPKLLGVGILGKTKIRLFAASASVWREIKSRHTPQGNNS